MPSVKQAAGQLFVGWLLSFCVMGVAASAVRPDAHASVEAVEQLLRKIAIDLDDPADRAAIRQLIAVFTARGIVSPDQTGPWVLLTFDRAGDLDAVAVNATRFLLAPPLIQHAVILHELEHLKRAKATRRSLDAVSPHGPRRVGAQAPSAETAGALHEIVRILVEDEYWAHRRDILYVEETVRAADGLAAYLATLPPAHRLPMAQYYRRSIEPFVSADGAIAERRLRRDLIFLREFPRRYRRYYEAALAWEALQGSVEIRRGRDGMLYPTHLLSPAAFLAWLLP